ncbi:MAG: NAD-dependent malic enzyme [Gammaproteobacteria bacterium]
MSEHDQHPTGNALLRDPAFDKSTAFTLEERERYGLTGLLPPAVFTQEQQVRRVVANLRRKNSDIERYIFLRQLQSRNERLFFRIVMDHIRDIMPLIYTPTVGEACREFAHIFRQTRGMYITRNERGRVRQVLDNWHTKDIRVVVVTDGERILGLGDLGANGMGIPIGKLALYVACAGIHPEQCLPVMLDVGTQNQELREQPLYLGMPEPRIRGDEYQSLVDEFVDAIADAYPGALLQFEDFSTPNAISLLARHRERLLCFNDDIQGTAAVALAGVYASTRISNIAFKDLRVLFLGAGSAATGIADLMHSALMDEGLSDEDARRRLWFVDRKGLITASRDNVADYSKPYAHEHAALDFHGAIETLRPHVLIGATGSPGAFDEKALRLMAKVTDRPTIFALSNPTSRAECTAEQAYEYTDCRALFASGSPFNAVSMNGREFKPGQGNNVYIFPGVGLGALFAQAKTIPDRLFTTAARALAAQITEDDLAMGSLYPPLVNIREVSAQVAVAVARQVFADTGTEAPEDLEHALRSSMFDPTY